MEVTKAIIVLKSIIDNTDLSIRKVNDNSEDHLEALLDCYKLIEK